MEQITVALADRLIHIALDPCANTDATFVHLGQMAFYLEILSRSGNHAELRANLLARYTATVDALIAGAAEDVRAKALALFAGLK